MAYPLTYLYLLASILTFATTVAVAATAPRQPVKRPIVICLAAIALWGLSNFLSNIATTPEMLGMLAYLFSPTWAFIPFLAIRIVLLFTERTHLPSGRALQWIFFLLCLLGEAFCLAGLLVDVRIPAPENGGAFGHLPTAFRWLVDLTYVAATITASLLLWISARGEERTRFLRHARLFSLVVLPATVFGLLTSGGQLWRYTHPPYLASVTAAFVACWVGVGMFRQSYFFPLAPIRAAFHAAEARFERLLQLSPDPLLVIDLDRTIVQANAPALTLLGFASLEAARSNDRDPLSHIHPDDLPTINEMRAQILSGETVRARSLRVTRGDRTPISLEVSARRITDASEQPRGVLVALRDVGPQRELEASLRQSQRLESLGLLATGIARDFEAHLATIDVDLRAGREAAASDPKTVALLDHARRGVEQASELLHELEAFAGTSSPKRVPVELNPLVSETLEILSSPPNGVALQPSLDASLPPLLGDAVRLRQVLLNLITNAREACKQDRGEILISTLLFELRDSTFVDSVSGYPAPLGAYVRLRVSDDGCGIEPELCARIFDPFFTSKGKGRGLGLSTVLGIVREHGGYTRIASRPDEGTTLDILFPAMESPVS